MNLERELWNEDPTKSWMKQHQCPDLRAYLKDHAFPLLEQRRKFISAIGSYRSAHNNVLPIPLFLITSDNVLVDRQMELCLITENNFSLPETKFNLSSTAVSNIVDEAMSELGKGDFFFRFMAYSKNATRVCVHFTTYHLEELCCLFKTTYIPMYLGGLEGEKLIFKPTVFTNEPMWERLRGQNPFFEQ